MRIRILVCSFLFSFFFSVGNSHQPSFGHPQVAIHVASWVSPAFADLVTEWIHCLLANGVVTLNQEPTLTVRAFT